MIVLNSSRCLNSTFGFGVLFVWSIIYTYTCISMISSKEAWKQVGKKYALIQPYCKTAWIYSPKIDFTSSSKNPKEITHKQSFDNGRLWNMNAIPSCRNASFDASQTYNFTATLIKHSWGQACPSCSIISIFNTVESFCSYVFVCFFWVKLIFLYHYHCLCSSPIFFLFSS